MSPALKAARTRSRPRRPRLRLLHGQGHARSERHGDRSAPRPELRLIPGPPRILIAGPDADRRAKLLDELAQTLPASIGFEETDSACDALEHAPGSRMAIITGDLGEISAETLMHMLTQRHPSLPVMIVDSPSRNIARNDATRRSALRL